MNLFDVYSRYQVEPISGSGCWITDKSGERYLDLYGGHAVISIGHSHPRFVEAITEQVGKLAFYSNSIVNPLGEELAKKLGEISGYDGYALFLCNSGAEAIENALKLASFKTQGKRVIAFDRAFHGRTSLAVAATNNQKIGAPINRTHHVTHLPLNDIGRFEEAVGDGTNFAAVLLEGVQGIGGIYEPKTEFLQSVAEICRKNNIPLILDEIQSGYGRTGKFFAHQHHGIRPDLITVAKGMGNGFPIGGVLISPEFTPEYGMLGTTFGGSHLACAAGLAVIDVLNDEKLLENSAEVGATLIDKLTNVPGIQNVRGRGLMIGIDFEEDSSSLRRRLLFDHHIFVGSATDKRTLRLLPPLSLSMEEAETFLDRLQHELQATNR
ncbi:MAG: aminotransferase class III-fold pyridoxal phosphate-dependent enzyme [Ignavibacteriae bacterium]|nr:aminotransferase class III-fold pyridoxal phosphate-dependent enzyme [Ignavibacteriota bacterium]MCB9215407.1 aminotransferase class III-fold pyridoxal phosphate-dependent enzyme [Ignavibacteria bacterium]